MNAHDASRFVRDYLRVRPKGLPGGVRLVNPTTAGLRRVLRNRQIDKRVRAHVYQWLLYRRHRRDR